ncbi:MAG: hypothetical protein JWO45_1695 [Spartobacteria bacterium]|nr:hypothetical protein [Spartobacteria bacterium]
MRLLHLVKLNGRRNRIGRTTVEPALTINWRAIRSEIDARRQSAPQFAGRCVVGIAMIGQIRDPAVERVTLPGTARSPRQFSTNSFPQHADPVARTQADVDISARQRESGQRVRLLICARLSVFYFRRPAYFSRFGSRAMPGNFRPRCTRWPNRGINMPSSSTRSRDYRGVRSLCQFSFGSWPPRSACERQRKKI